jgi:hypothetical protein
MGATARRLRHAYQRRGDMHGPSRPGLRADGLPPKVQAHPKRGGARLVVGQARRRGLSRRLLPSLPL